MLGEAEEVGIADVRAIEEREEVEERKPWDKVKVAEGG